MVRAHRAAETDSHPWADFRIDERYYYKLLARFAQKDPDGRYVLDDAIKSSIRDYLSEQERRKAAMEFLRGRGFSDAAARKWLQRHGIDEIATAKPRRPREGG